MSNQNDQLAQNLINKLIHFATLLSAPQTNKPKEFVTLGEERVLKTFQETFIQVGKLGLQPAKILDENFPSIFQRRLIN